MLYSERKVLTNCLLDKWQDSINENGLILQDREAWEVYWMNCICALVAYELLDIEKCREFMEK